MRREMCNHFEAGEIDVTMFLQIYPLLPVTRKHLLLIFSKKVIVVMSLGKLNFNLAIAKLDDGNWLKTFSIEYLWKDAYLWKELKFFLRVFDCVVCCILKSLSRLKQYRIVPVFS